MKRYFHTLAFTIAAALMAVLTAACTEDESEIGLNLVDPMTVYDGKIDTLYADWAYGERDDSLRTSGYSYCAIGNYRDAVFGAVTSTLYTQVALPAASNSINFAPGSGIVIDSVVLYFVRDALYPDSTRDYRFHFEVRTLAEPVLADTVYYGFDSIAVDMTRKAFFDDVVTVRSSDTLIRLRLDDDFRDVIGISAEAADFAEAVKGLRIRILDDADQGVVSVDMSAMNTRLSAYYHFGDIDTAESEYQFDIGNVAAHFMHYGHDYSGTEFGGRDSVGAMDRMCLEPLGGYNVWVSFDSAVKRFHREHPEAAIHHAEMLLPVAATNNDGATRPDRIMAFVKDTGNVERYINDIIDAYMYAGFDGQYYSDKNAYRLRVTQHLQGMLRADGDKGTMLVLNSRRNSAARTILNGPNSDKPLKIVFVYSE